MKLRRVYSKTCLRIYADVGQDRREKSIFLEFWKVSKNKCTKMGPQVTVQANFGLDLWEFQIFGLPLSPVLHDY